MPSILSRVASWLGYIEKPKENPLPRPQENKTRTIRGRYDSAAANEEHRRYWSNAVLESPTAENQPGVREILRNRSRYEYANNGYYSGMVRGRADDLVGTGPTLQILTDDEAVAEQVETAFAAWAKATHLAEKLHTMDQARDRDGAAWAVLRTNPGVANPVKLDVRPIEDDRVAPPWGVIAPILPLPLNDTGEVGQYFDGITYDTYGNPVSYTVLRQHPGDVLQTFPRPYDNIPARYMLHWFRRDRPGQLRGVPEMTSGLPLFAYLRRWTLANLNAAEVAATMGGGMLESTAPADPDTVEPSPFSSLDMERGMMTELPAGFTFKQLQAQFPQTSYGEFKKEVLMEAGRPIRMPANVIVGTSAGYNFSSAKLDHYQYRGAIKVDRSFAEAHVLEPVFLAWLEEARLIPGLLPAGIDIASLPRAWYWPGWPSMDKDEAKNVTEELHNGTTTLADELAGQGKDWRTQVRQMGKEAKLRTEEGVPLPAPGGASPFGGGGGGAAPPQAEPKNPFGAERNGHGSGGAGRFDFRRQPRGAGRRLP